MEINFNSKKLLKYKKDLDNYYSYVNNAKNAKPARFYVSRKAFADLKQTVSSDIITYRGIPVVCH